MTCGRGASIVCEQGLVHFLFVNVEAKMSYRFFGWEQANVSSISSDYPGVCTPRDLYDALSDLWGPETCAPRMADKWTRENKTLGQCSITAFLAQDIFGGLVYGIERADGNCHCYNVVGDCVFDLTSEQFGDEKLDYSLQKNSVQSREAHFAKDEKETRYQKLRAALREKLSRRGN